MASATTPRGKAVAAPTKDAGTEAAASVPSTGVNRREFLNYIWGASMVLLLAEFSGAVLWFMLPRFRAGEFGGVFIVDPAAIPQASPTSTPLPNSAGRFWMSNTGDGFRALSMVCTHLGCLFKWVPTNNRFECPCHGSKFTNQGVYISGPAPRSLDSFAVTATYSDGTIKQSPPEGGPVPSTNLVRLDVNTGKKVKGVTHA